MSCLFNSSINTSDIRHVGCSHLALRTGLAHNTRSDRCPLFPGIDSRRFFPFAVVRQGEIVEQGSHAELIARPDGAYATLVRLQASAQNHDADSNHQLSEDTLQRSQDPSVLQEVVVSQVSIHAFARSMHAESVSCHSLSKLCCCACDKEQL